MENTNELYKECLRNHAASLGSYATDGCGEFTPVDDAATFHCAACGCHRNFHRRVSSTSYINNDMAPPPPPEMAEYGRRTTAAESPESERSGGGGGGKIKRFRTKFTAEQKEKMLAFAEKLGWKLQRKEEEDEIERFCRGLGVSRKVFKVWMHNHKNNSSTASASTANNASSLTQ